MQGLLCDSQVRDMADGSQIWIAKPSITNQAIGVCIFDRVSQVRMPPHQPSDPVKHPP